MSTFSFVEQLLARDPRKLVRFPDFPVDAAMAELRELQEQLAQAEKQVNAPAPAAPVSGSTPPIPGAAPEGMGPSIATLATQIWRTKAKLVDTATGEPREEARKVYRHVEGALEALGQMGITLNDWLNQPYDPGLPVKVITFQPTTGIVRDTVVETVRPTVIWKDQLLQLGEVVVGIPPNTEKPQ
jgi:hypothetical protein